MELPALKLEIAAGPRKDETQEFQPGSTIRLGRVARGNNVTIKDSGISSKHLQIGSESGKWTIQDLDSSNGTFLNSSKLTPFTPSDLRDGDTVKLGEVTSITVHFGEFPSQLRRNPRRKANEGESKEKQNVEEKPRRGRARRGKVLDQVLDVEKESEISAAVAEEPEVRMICLISNNGLENRGCGEVKLEPESVNVRVTRSRRNNNNNLISENLEESLNVRVTRSRKNKESSISKNLGEDCGRVTRKGRKRRKNLPELPVDETVEGPEKKEGLGIEGKGEDLGAGVSVNDDDAQKRVEGDEKLGSRNETVEDAEKKEGLGIEGKGEGGGPGVGVNEGDARKRVEGTEKSGSGKETVDLDKVTLGEWFDLMEEYIPKQIIETTEKMVDEMRRKAERVHEYMMEQKKAKGLSELTTGLGK